MKSISTKVNLSLFISFIRLLLLCKTTPTLAQNVFPAPGFENKQWETINSPQIQLIKQWNLVGIQGIYSHAPEDGNEILFHDLEASTNAQTISVQQFMQQEASEYGKLFFQKNGKIVLANGNISEDGGLTWWSVRSKKNMSLPFGGYNEVLSVILIDETIFVSTGWSGILKSVNCGASWQTVNNGIGGDLNGKQNLHHLQYINGVFYAFGENFVINPPGQFNSTHKIGYYSTDLGGQWYAITAEGIDNSFWIRGALVTDSGDIFLTAYKSYNYNPATEINGGVWKKTNGGVWQKISGINENDFLAIIRKGNRMIVLSTSSIYESLDNGTTWHVIREDHIFTDDYLPRARFGFVTPHTMPITIIGDKLLINQKGISCHSFNDDNFYTIPFFDPLMQPNLFNIGVNDILFIGKKLWAATYNGIYFSIDNGITFEHLEALRFTEPLNFLLFNGSLFVATKRGIFRSDDGGVTWNKKSEGLINSKMRKIRLIDGVLYAVSDYNEYIQPPLNLLNDYKSHIYRSFDFGESWEIYVNANGVLKYGVTTYGYIQDFFIKDNSIFVATSGSNGLLRSKDSGNTWSSINSGLESGYSNDTGTYVYGFTMFKEKLFVGVERAVPAVNFVSQNKGDSWEQLPLQGTSELPYNIAFTFSEVNDHLIGTFGDPFFGNIPSSYITKDGINWFKLPELLESMYPLDFEISGDYLYAGGYGPLARIDLTNSSLNSSIIFNTPSSMVFNSDDFCLPMIGQNLTNLTALQFTLEWDPAVATYNGFVASALPGFGNANLGTQDVANGKLYVSWSSPNLTPVTLPDDTELINLSFTATGNPGASTTLSFSNVELIGLNNIVLPHTTENGSITINDQITISGNIIHRNIPLSNINVQLNQSLQTATQANGSYSQTVNWNDTYTLVPSKEANANTYPQNLNAADLAYYQQVLLQQTSTSDALQLKALDVSNNQQVSIQDKTITESVILGLIDGFPNRAAWQFVPANFTGSHAFEYPPAPQFTQPTNHITQNFQAIHLGDVVSNEINTRTKDGYSLQYIIQEEKTDNQSNYYLTIQADVLPDVSAIQGSLTLPEGMTININDNPKQVQTNATANSIKWVWVQEEGQATTLTKGTTLFTLTLNSETPIEKTKLISELSSGTTLANLAVDGNLQSSVYQYSITEEIKGDEEGWYISLPFPNPQHKETESLYVNVKQPQGTTLTMRLTTVQGQQVKETKFTLNGTEERIILTEKPNKGIYLIELSTNTGQKKVSKLVVE